MKTLALHPGLEQVRPPAVQAEAVERPPDSAVHQGAQFGAVTSRCLDGGWQFVLAKIQHMAGCALPDLSDTKTSRNRATMQDSSINAGDAAPAATSNPIAPARTGTTDKQGSVGGSSDADVRRAVQIGASLIAAAIVIAAVLLVLTRPSVEDTYAYRDGYDSGKYGEANNLSETQTCEEPEFWDEGGDSQSYMTPKEIEEWLAGCQDGYRETSG